MRVHTHTHTYVYTHGCVEQEKTENSVDLITVKLLQLILCSSYARDRPIHVFAAFCESVIVSKQNVKIINEKRRGLCQDGEHEWEDDFLFFY